jgi:hypothetical protein
VLVMLLIIVLMSIKATRSTYDTYTVWPGPIGQNKLFVNRLSSSCVFDVLCLLVSNNVLLYRQFHLVAHNFMHRCHPEVRRLCLGHQHGGCGCDFRYFLLIILLLSDLFFLADTIQPPPVQFHLTTSHCHWTSGVSRASASGVCRHVSDVIIVLCKSRGGHRCYCSMDKSSVPQKLSWAIQSFYRIGWLFIAEHFSVL